MTCADLPDDEYERLRRDHAARLGRLNTPAMWRNVLARTIRARGNTYFRIGPKR